MSDPTKILLDAIGIALFEVDAACKALDGACEAVSVMGRSDDLLARQLFDAAADFAQCPTLAARDRVAALAFRVQTRSKTTTPLEVEIAAGAALPGGPYVVPADRLVTLGRLDGTSQAVREADRYARARLVLGALKSSGDVHELGGALRRLGLHVESSHGVLFVGDSRSVVKLVRGNGCWVAQGVGLGQMALARRLAELEVAP